jgi:hypothetical protein
MGMEREIVARQGEGERENEIIISYLSLTYLSLLLIHVLPLVLTLILMI